MVVGESKMRFHPPFAAKAHVTSKPCTLRINAAEEGEKPDKIMTSASLSSIQRHFWKIKVTVSRSFNRLLWSSLGSKIPLSKNIRLPGY